MSDDIVDPAHRGVPPPALRRRRPRAPGDGGAGARSATSRSWGRWWAATSSVLARAIGARRVFELGSGYGYSALHFARAVGEGGERALHRAVGGERRAWPQGFLEPGRRLGPRAPTTRRRRRPRCAAWAGPGTSSTTTSTRTATRTTVDLAYEHLRPGGLFITDNVLWSGRVLEGEDDGIGGDARACRSSRAGCSRTRAS